MANTLKFGNGEWYGKKDTILAYNDLNSNYKPLPFNFSRDSKATVVNKDGLIEEVGSGQPRVDYLNNTKGALKLEPSRTNLVTYSNGFTDSSWLPTGATVVSGVISPDGTSNAFTLSNTASSGIIQKAVSLTGLRVVSIFAKKGTHRYLRIGAYGGTNSYANFDLENGVVADGANANIEDYGNGWFRCICHSADGATGGVQIFPSNNTTGAATTNGSIQIYGVQLEEGSFPTSYIKSNSGSAVTRLADDIDTDFGTILPLNGEVSVYIEMLGQPTNGINTTGKVVSVNFDSLNNGQSYVSLNFNGTDWRARVQNATGSNFVSFDVDQTETIKALFVLRPTSYALYANGSLIGSETRTYSGTAPNINEISKVIYLMQSDSFGITRNKDLRVYNTALSNAEAIALTQV